MEEQLVSVAEFARLAGGIKPGTVHNWLYQGKFGLRRFKVGGRTMLAKSDLQKVIREVPQERKSA